MKKIVGYIFFVPIFLLTNVLCNNILVPVLEFFFRMMSLAVTTPPTFLWQFIIEPAIITGSCIYISLSLSILVYPGINKTIPIVICSVILLLINLLSVYLFNSLYNLLLELDPNSLEEISTTKFYIGVISTLVGYAFGVYGCLNEKY